MYLIHPTEDRLCSSLLGCSASISKNQDRSLCMNKSVDVHIFSMMKMRYEDPELPSYSFKAWIFVTVITVFLVQGSTAEAVEGNTPKSMFKGRDSSKSEKLRRVESKEVKAYLPRNPLNTVLDEVSSLEANHVGINRDFARMLEDSLQCSYTNQPVVVIDAGSTKTRGSLIVALTEYCPMSGRGRIVVENSITSTRVESIQTTSMRRMIENFIRDNISGPYLATTDQDEQLMSNAERLLAVARAKVTELLGSMEKPMLEMLPSAMIEDARVIGIPVIYGSTGGVRDLAGRLRDAFFFALREAITAYVSENGFTFFTTSDFARPVSGVDEGIYTFLTVNYHLGSLAAYREAGRAGASCRKWGLRLEEAHRDMVGLIEVGGASSQYVFPLSPTVIPPSFIRTTSLTRGHYLDPYFPPLHVVSVSFMQLGSESSLGLVLKEYCQTSVNTDKVCNFPCFSRGYTQGCTLVTQKVAQGKMVGTSDSPFFSVASFCDKNQTELSLKPINHFLCKQAGIDPDESLAERMSIKNCDTIVGTGDFEECSRVIDRLLIDRKYPLPANTEAMGIGFDTPAQIFQFLPTDAVTYVTGNSIVKPLSMLQDVGYIKKDFRGELSEIRKGGEAVCSAEVKEEDDQLKLVFDNGQKIEVDAFSYPSCFRVSYAACIVKAMHSGSKKPSPVMFTSVAPVESSPKLGWSTGIVLI